MKFIVERITDGFAVLESEDMTHTEVDLRFLPDGIKTGNILIFDGNVYCVDFDAETETRKRIAEKQKSVFKKR